MTAADRVQEDEGAEIAIDAIKHLAGEIGSRAPSGPAEEAAAVWFGEQLIALGLEPEMAAFPAYRSFGRFYLPLFAVALISRRLRNPFARFCGGLLAVIVGWWEGEYRSWGRLARICPGRSRNVAATIEPGGGAERTVCLVCHLDSSRSGMMFHPSIGAYLGWLVGAVSASVAGSTVGPVLRRAPLGLGTLGRAIDRLSGALLGFGFGLMLERELRGSDVPGANDNASGVGACLALAKRLTEQPLVATRVVILATGAEEAGLLGMRSFLDGRDTEGWLFLNLDGVGASAPLRYLRVEGGPLNPRPADEAMMRLAEEIAQGRPDLGLSACDHGSGMPYDSTAVLARGGRALTITTQGRTIPNYHWPTDLPEAIDRAALGRAIEFAQEMLAGVDRGAADRRV